MLANLRSYYSALTSLTPLQESLPTAELVHRYREYWKPEKVKVLLLAESHMLTPDAERRQFAHIPRSDLPNYPTDYARFVYCLGYGERSLLLPGNGPASGTPQFWKIFFACINPVASNASFNPILKADRDTARRIVQKIDLLRQMRARGIWLLDASPIALKRPSGEELAPPDYRTAMSLSWAHYLEPALAQLSPVHTIVIGDGVFRAFQQQLDSSIGRKAYTTLLQPQARITATKHFAQFAAYHQVCKTYAP